MLISMDTFFLLLESDDLGALILWHQEPLCPETTIMRSADGTLQII